MIIFLPCIQAKGVRVASIFGRGSALSGANRLVSRVRQSEVPPIKLQLGSRPQGLSLKGGLRGEASGKFSGFYVNFRPGENL